MIYDCYCYLSIKGFLLILKLILNYNFDDGMKNDNKIFDLIYANIKNNIEISLRYCMYFL